MVFPALGRLPMKHSVEQVTRSRRAIRSSCWPDAPATADDEDIADVVAPAAPSVVACSLLRAAPRTPPPRRRPPADEGGRRREVAEYANQCRRGICACAYSIPLRLISSTKAAPRRPPPAAAGDPQVPPVSRGPASAEPGHPCYCPVRLVWFAGSNDVAGERSGLSLLVVHGRFAGSGHPVRGLCDPGRSVVVLQPLFRAACCLRSRRRRGNGRDAALRVPARCSCKCRSR